MKKTYIEKLREKPVHHRKRIAYGTSAVITALIAFVWVTSYTFLNGTPSTTTQQVAQTDKTNSPFDVIKESVASAYGAITGNKLSSPSQATTTATLEYVPESEVTNQ
jgi:hypothetical protein